MSEDLAPAEAGQAEPSGAPETGQAQQPDWQQQYTELRSAFNQRDAEIAELRQLRDNLTNPETQAEVLNALGFDVQQEAEAQQQQQEYEDPYEQRLASIEAQNQQLLVAFQERQQHEAQQQQEQQTALHVGTAVTQLEAQLGRELNESELEFLLPVAYSNPDDHGVPNVALAWERLDAAYQQQQQRYLQTKKAPRVPDGQSASKGYDLSTPAGKREAMEARLAELDDETVVS